MAASHNKARRPSALLALLCLALVHRLRPAWTAVALCDAALAEGESPERLSRLASRAVPLFERVVATLMRRGRPAKDNAAVRAATEHALNAELLALATARLAQLSRRLGADARALMLGAFLRLRAAHPALTQKCFCAALAIPERTFRHWRAQPPPSPAGPAATSTPAAPKRKRAARRGRFAFNLLLPDTQLAADTTDIKAFGVPLKLIAAQDVGGRDQDLFDDVVIDDHESAVLVVEVLTRALADAKGAQAVTDQGTPYMAADTLAALEALEVEHAPQPEGAPTKKATIERAFRTIKSIAAPLLALTDKLAATVPALENPSLAKAAASLVVTALLRAYQAGARAARRACLERDGLAPDDLARAAERSREQARARDHSARQLLEHIHTAYAIDIPLACFRRAFRRFPLEVLREAERAFARQAHRADIKKRASYFAAVVRACERTFRDRCARERDGAERRAQLATVEHDDQRRREHWRAHPAEWLAHALDTIAALWLPELGELVGGGVGAGTAHAGNAVARLVELHGAAFAADTAVGVTGSFATTWRPRIGEQGVAAVLAVFWRRLDHLRNAATTDAATRELARQFGAAMLQRTGPPWRPAPSGFLRN